MKNIKSVAITLVAVSILLLSLVKCSSDADNDRRTKAQACIYLVRAALHHNEDYFGDVTKTLKYQEKNVDDLVQKWMDKTLLNCYNTVSLIKSADLIGRNKPEKISPYAKDNMEILNVSNFHKRYDTDSARLEKDSERFRKTLEDLKEELAPLTEATRKYANELISQAKKQQYQEDMNKKRMDQEDIGDYEYGNVHMGFLRRMDPNVQLAIGLGLIATFALLFYLGYRAITQPKVTDKVKKKNK